jgi:hypothetical protein
MTLTKDNLTFPRYMSRGRYYRVDADGEVGNHGNVQRPAAERNLKYSGYGLWDAREGEVVIQPDAERRLERLREAISYKRDEIVKLDQKIDSILRTENE